MRSHGFALLSIVSLVAAQTFTVIIPDGPTVVQAFTTNDKGFTFKTNIATLTPSSSSPASTPSLAKPTTLPTSSPTATASGKPGASPPTRTNGIPLGAIIGIIVGVVALLGLALGIFLYKRRKRRRGRRFSKVELDPLGSPVADKRFAPDPFITDTQAIRLGYDRTQLPTRRIEARFVNPEEDTRTAPIVPRILLTRDGEVTGRPISLSSSGHHGASPTSPTPTRPRFYGDTKFTPAMPPPSTTASSSTTLTEAPSSSTQAELAQRMRDLLVQLEHHSVSPNSDSQTAVTHLQRQVEVLQRENDELRNAGGEAPPAYDSHLP